MKRINAMAFLRSMRFSWHTSKHRILGRFFRVALLIGAAAGIIISAVLSDIGSQIAAVLSEGFKDYTSAAKPAPKAGTIENKQEPIASPTETQTSASTPPAAHQAEVDSFSESGAKASAPAAHTLVRAIQSELKRLGLYSDRIDGVAGSNTTHALKEAAQLINQPRLPISQESLSLLRSFNPDTEIADNRNETTGAPENSGLDGNRTTEQSLQAQSDEPEDLRIEIVLESAKQFSPNPELVAKLVDDLTRIETLIKCEDLALILEHFDDPHLPSRSRMDLAFRHVAFFSRIETRECANSLIPRLRDPVNHRILQMIMSLEGGANFQQGRKLYLESLREDLAAIEGQIDRAPLSTIDAGLIASLNELLMFINAATSRPVNLYPDNVYFDPLHKRRMRKSVQEAGDSLSGALIESSH